MADWICHRTGDCCREAQGVVATEGEVAAMRAAAPDVTVARQEVATPDPDTGTPRVHLFRVDGSPGCPYYDDGCRVYDVRPGPCRAFGCFRRSATDPYRGVSGATLRWRESAGVRRRQLEMVRDAADWTKAHP